MRFIPISPPTPNMNNTPGKPVSDTITMSDGAVVDDGPTFDVLRNRCTLEVANLVPPQVVDVSLAMTRLRPPLSGTPVARANTIEQMCDAVAAHVGVTYVGERGLEGEPR